MTRYQFAVEDMCCGGCENAINTAVGDIDGVSRVTADSDTNTVTIRADRVETDDLRASIENAGFSLA